MLARASPGIADMGQIGVKPKKQILALRKSLQDSLRDKNLSTRTKSICQSESPASEYLRWSQTIRPSDQYKTEIQTGARNGTTFAERLRKSLQLARLSLNSSEFKQPSETGLALEPEINTPPKHEKPPIYQSTSLAYAAASI